MAAHHDGGHTQQAILRRVAEVTGATEEQIQAEPSPFKLDHLPPETLKQGDKPDADVRPH